MSQTQTYNDCDCVGNCDCEYEYEYGEWGEWCEYSEEEEGFEYEYEKEKEQPKRSKSAYNHFCASNREQLKYENPDMKNPDIIRQLGINWSEIKKKPEELAVYQELALHDKDRYQQEMWMFMMEDEPEVVPVVVEDEPVAPPDAPEVVPEVVPVVVEDEPVAPPDAPEVVPDKKIPKRGFTLYCKENRSRLKEENVGVKASDISAMLSQGWSDVSKDKKNEFHVRYNNNK
jgi:hypothetical protein